MAEPHQITIRACPFGGSTFDITVEPAPAWACFDAERPTIRAARRYAESLKTVHGWKVVDKSGEAK